MTPSLRLASSLLAVAVLAAPLAAQQPVGRAVSLSAGASTFDASGTGTAPMGALRIEQPLVGRWLLAEAGVGYARLDEQFADSPTHLGILEGQVQFQLPLAHFRPYVGFGGGWVSYLSNAGGRERFPGSGSAAAGARIPLGERVGLRGELRIRGWRFHSARDGYTNGAAETTVGMSFAL